MDDASLEIVLGIMGGIAILAVIGFVVQAVAYWKIAEKTNHPNAWFALLPILQTVLLHDVAFGTRKRKFAYALLAVPAIVNLLSTLLHEAGSLNIGSTHLAVILLVVVYSEYMRYNFGKAFGKGWVFYLVGFIPLAALVQLLMLGFGSSEYHGYQKHISEKF